MFRWLLCAACLAFATALPARAQALPPAQALRALFAAEWERGLRDSPENASYNGDRRFDDRWSDLSLAAIASRDAADRAALERLHAIDRRALSPADRLDYDTFEWLAERTVERQKFQEYLQPVSHQGGVQTADSIAEAMSFASAADCRNYLRRMAALPALVDQVIVLMQEGVKAGNMPPRLLMERVTAQIDAQIVDDPTTSPFYRPLRKFADGISPADRTALAAEAQATIREKVVPAYRRFKAFFVGEYLPKARSTVALADAPGGKAYYDFLARYFTSTDLGAEQIHEIGLKEVARLRTALERVQAETGFKGSMAEFFRHLRSDPRFFYKTPAELLSGYQAVAKRIDPELVKVFKTFPRLPYGVRGIPDNIAPDSSSANYQGGTPDFSRAGFFNVNLHQPETRPTWEMLTLTLHEAVPGHHFQISRALELADAPMFRRTAFFVAYGEGWALYAEQLGYDMGLYDNPYDRFGQLCHEMWRAVRLVVDTGMQVKGWTRERAIRYFRDNVAIADAVIVNEVDRYLGNPGQALAYKIGQMKISELRARAAAALGPKFDLREYHDAVLETGAVPLAALEARIDGWIAERKTR